MDIKGSGFIENIMIAAALSEVEGHSAEQQTTVKGKLEKKVIALLDMILSSLSSSYREARVKIAGKVKMMHEAHKYGAVTTATEKIFTDKKDTTSEKEKVKSDKTAAQEQKLTQVKQQMKDLVDAFPDFLQAMDVEHLSETNSEIEEKGRAYQEQKNEALLAEYLLRHPEVLAAISLTSQEIVSAELAGNFSEAFGDLDPKGLSETNLDIEYIAQHFQADKEMKEFNQYISENPGAFLAFMLLMRMAINKMDSESA